MAIRECRVSLIDDRGVCHSTTVYANTVLEAAAIGLKQIRETEILDDDNSFLDLTVELTTTTTHRVPLARLKAWLESAGGPREAARKAKLR
jgi:hypothetical protein